MPNPRRVFHFVQKAVKRSRRGCGMTRPPKVPSVPSVKKTPLK